MGNNNLYIFLIIFIFIIGVLTFGIIYWKKKRKLSYSDQSVQYVDDSNDIAPRIKHIF